MFRKAALSGTVALAALSIATAAHAADAVADAEADAGTVRRSGDDILVVGTRTVTDGSSGTKTDTPLVETPQSISVITSEDLSNLGLQNLNQALRFVAGVTPESRGASAEVYDQFKLRGFDVDRYLDGLRIFNSPTGYANPQIDVSRIDRYEIVKGPASVLYGSASPGGLVAIGSRLPQQQDFYGSIAGTYGSYDLYRVDADVGGRTGQVAYRLYGSANGADSQTRFGRRERQTVSGAVTLFGDTRTTLTVLGNYSHDPYNGNYGVYPASGTLFANPNGKLPTRFYGGQPGDRFKREQAAGTYIFLHDFDGNWAFRSSGRYQYTSSALGIYYTNGTIAADQRTVGRSSYATREKLNAWTFDNQLAGEVKTGPITHTLLLGTDRQVLRATEAFAFGGGTPVDIFDPVYGTDPTIPAGDVTAVPAGPFGVFGGAYTARLRQQGIYAQDQMSLGGFRLTLSGRYDWARTEQVFVGFPGQAKKDEKFTYRAGLLYVSDIGLSPYVSYSTSFQPQITSVFDDVVTLANPRLADPATGRQIEAGLKYQPPGTQILLTASVFRITQNNVVVSSPLFINTQTGRVRSKGVEFEATAPLPYGFNTRLAFSRQSVKTVRDTAFPLRVGRGLYGVGKGNITAYLDWAPKDGRFAGFQIGGDVRHVMSVFAGGIGDPRFPGGLRTPSYTLFDALVSYDLAKMSPRLEGAKLQVNATNLFDKRHLTSCYLDFGSDWCWYGSRRTVQGTISYKW